MTSTKSRPVTQKQIALHLGISQSLVAEALNGHPKISATTREKVEHAARELGYNVNDNRAARTLVARRHGRRIRQDVIAVVMPPDPFEGDYLSQVPYFMSYISGVQAEAAAHGMDVFTCSPHDGVLPRLIREGGVDGLIFVGGSPRHCGDLAGLDLPQLDLGFQQRDQFSLLSDDTPGARLAAEHLLSLGHRELAYIGLDFTIRQSRERWAAFNDTVRAAGATATPIEVAGYHYSPNIPNGREATTQLLSSGQPFTAIFCYNDLFAIGAIQQLQEAGLRVPQDVSIVGFDDVSLFYGFKPEITSVGFDRANMGRRAVVRLLESLDSSGNEGEPGPNEIFPTWLQIRESTAAKATK